MENKIYHYELGIYSLVSLVTGYFNENSYILKNNVTNGICVIDPGDDLEQIKKVIGDFGGRVEIILLTHGHFDHWACVEHLHRSFSYEIPCWVHSLEKKIIRLGSFYSIRFCQTKVVVPEKINFYQFEEEKKCHINVNGFNVNVMFTPGHTKGSVCLQMADFIFTGDTLFYEAVGSTNPPEGDPYDLTTSIDRLLCECKSSLQIFPGHGRPWQIGDALTWWEKEKYFCQKNQISTMKTKNDINL